MKQKLISARDFVQKHKTAIAVMGTAAAAVALNRKALQQHDEFLKEHDLYYEFYPYLAKDE